MKKNTIIGKLLFLLKQQHVIFLILIVLLAIFLRGYNAMNQFDFSHDGDLYSWTAVDMIKDKHFRLIGQETSTQGIFIGAGWYYTTLPFFILFSMEPDGLVWLGILLGITTTLSFYYIFRKVFNEVVGLVAGFLHAVMLIRVEYERWIVPTMTSSLWEVWYFFVLVQLARGNFNWLWMLGVLVGIIWHINFSLAPTLLAVPVAVLISKKWPSIKQIFIGAIAFFISAIPLITFELLHGFSQVQHFIKSFTTPQGGKVGLEKFLQAVSQVGGNSFQMVFYPERGSELMRVLTIIAFIILGAIFVWKKKLNTKIGIILLTWFLGVMVFFTFSSKIITEYYFHSLEMVVMVLLIVALSLIFEIKKYGKYLGILIVGIIISYSFYQIVFDRFYNRLGYHEKRAVANYINEDAKRRGFDCVGLTFITSPGHELGFRYVTYLENLKTKPPGSGVAVYNIVMPVTLAEAEVKEFIGAYGVIPPKDDVLASEVNQYCEGENYNLTQPMFGYTE